MEMEMTRQTQFTFGEVDVQTWKRTDINEYLTAAQSLKNCEVGTTGLVKKRKGTSLLLNVTGCAQFNSRMYEFVDKNGDYYVILSADGHFCIYSAPSDMVQVVTNTANVVTKRGTNVVAFATNLTLIQTVPVPYQTGDLDDLDYTQDNEVLIITSPTYAPGRIFIRTYNNPAPPTFDFEYINIYPYPAYDFSKINYNQYTVALGGTLTSGGTMTFAITNPSGDPTGFTSDWIGGQIVGGGTTVTDPIGYGFITGFSESGSTVTFNVLVQVSFAAPGAGFGSLYSIKQPVWKTPAAFPAVNSVTSGFPRKCLFFQNRLWMANTNTLPNTVFGSKINQPINYDVGTGRDTDAIIYTLGQTSAGGILWLNGGKQLEIFCRNYEFACPQDQNAALTPSTFSVRQQSAYGASSLLKPVTYINDSYYSTKTGKALINFHYNGIGLTYSSSNISAASSHLVKAPINRALLRGTDTNQDNFIYFLNDSDDTLTAFQFITELKLAALTPAIFQDRVQLIDICTIANQVYILKFYERTEQYTIEVFDDSTHTDCTFTANMASTGIVTGLSLLEGYTVQVVYQNQDFGQYVVVGGQITVVNPDAIADTVFIGLLYDVEITPMYFFAGAALAQFKKLVTRIYVDYYNSINFNINGKLVPYENYPMYSGKPITAQTDTVIVDPVFGYNRFNTFSITQSSPFDLEILSIAYQIEAFVI